MISIRQEIGLSRDFAWRRRFSAEWLLRRLTVRPEPDSNRRTRLCRPLPNHSVIGPELGPDRTQLLRTTAFVITAGAALYPYQEGVLRYLAIILAAATVLLLTTNAHGAVEGRPQPALIARISKHVFGPRWRTAACIAHYESTDGAHLVNGPNLGPWQINVAAHPWVNARRLITDWWYSARVAYRISDGGRDWSAWSTRSLCGV